MVFCGTPPAATVEDTGPPKIAWGLPGTYPGHAGSVLMPRAFTTVAEKLVQEERSDSSGPGCLATRISPPTSTTLYVASVHMQMNQSPFRRIHTWYNQPCQGYCRMPDF